MVGAMARRVTTSSAIEPERSSTKRMSSGIGPGVTVTRTLRGIPRRVNALTNCGVMSVELVLSLRIADCGFKNWPTPGHSDALDTAMQPAMPAVRHQPQSDV
eukprot:Amastigsp_a510961_115.p10 type:complete len:102 gc:universal Amastigsp_a510961_115:2756-3061(+)